jgi:protein O-GlcNAc transferase
MSTSFIERLLAQAHEHAAQGRREAAKAICQSVLRAQPTHRLALVLFQTLNTSAEKEALEASQAPDTEAEPGVSVSALSVSAPAPMPQPPAERITALQRLFAAQRYSEFLEEARALARRFPAHPMGWVMQGAALQHLGRPEDAVRLFAKAAQQFPDLPGIHNNLGVVLNTLKKTEEAEAAYRRAIALDPDYVSALSNLGALLNDERRTQEALPLLEKAVSKDPKAASVLSNLAVALVSEFRYDEALLMLDRAIAAEPEMAAAWANRGAALSTLQRSDEAFLAIEKALSLAPEDPLTHFHRAGTLGAYGLVEEAIAAYEKVLSLKPDHEEAYSSLLFRLAYLGQGAEPAFVEKARAYGAIVAQKRKTRFTHAGLQTAPKRLRVGFVSADFRNHPVGYFLEGLIPHLNPDRLELMAYSAHRTEDDLTARIKPFFSTWRSLVGLGDDQAAQRIHADAPHILIDLSGHTAHHRLPVFARKPAPVQATWLGYFATTGLQEIDWFIADATGVPPEHQNQFVEKLCYLPTTRLCFTPPPTAPAVSPLPWLENGYPTLGCFQNLSKITTPVLSAWAQILQAVPKARLRIQSPGLKTRKAKEAFEARMRDAGLVSERVSLHEGLERQAYLDVHREVDFILDTFPYPGGTTTCEALWMGVPTVSLAGNTLIARQGASLLNAAGLGEWVADDLAAYIEKACSWAAQPHELANLRATLRERVRASPLYDGALFAMNLEQALWGMWAQYEQKPTLTR